MASPLDTPTSTSDTTSHTYSVGAGNQRCLIVGIEQEGTTLGAPTVTYGGQSMTNVVDHEINPGSTSQRVTLFYLNDAGIVAASGTTISVSNSVAASISIHAASYQDAMQTTPTNTDTDGSTAATPNPLAACDIVTGAADAVVVALSGMGNSGTAAWGGTLTERTDQQANATATGSLADDSVPSATTIACDCTWTTQNRAAICALELEHDAGVGISSIDPTDFRMDTADIDVIGSGFEASQGTGSVYLSDADTLAGSANEVDITDAAIEWADDLVTLDLFRKVSSHYSIFDGNINMDTERGVGQSFPGDGNVLGFARFQLAKTGSPTGDVFAELYAHSGTFGTSSIPTGAALATSAVIDASALSGSFADYLFDFSSSAYTLANGTNYVIALMHATGDGSNYVQIRRDDTTLGHAGNYSEYNGTSWSALSTRDLQFWVYSEPHDFVASLHGLGLGTGLGQRYVILVNDSSDEFGSPGITLRRPKTFVMSPGALTPGATTSRLTGMTGTFAGGRAEEAVGQNPSTTDTDVASDGNRQDLHSIEATAGARVVGDATHVFRMLYGGNVADTITQTPTVTITSGLAASIVGSVTITATPGALLDFQQHPAIAGAGAIALSPGALLDHQQHPAIGGNVPVALVPAAALDHRRHPAIAGDAPIALSPAALLDYRQHPAIAGDVPLALSPAAVLDFTGAKKIVGNVPLALTPAAALDFTGSKQILGDVPLALTPAALLDYRQHAALVGALTVALLPAALLDFEQHPAIAGAGAIALLPAALLDFEQHPAIAGAVTVALSPAAALSFVGSKQIFGDVTVALTPAAPLDFEQHPALVGDGAIALLPAAALAYASHGQIVGDVPLSLLPAAAMEHRSHAVIAGAGQIMLSPAALLDFTRHPALAGDGRIALSPAALLDFEQHPALLGDGRIVLLPAAILVAGASASVIIALRAGLAVNPALRARLPAPFGLKGRHNAGISLKGRL